MYRPFRYIYNWFTRCPRVIFFESVQALKKSLGSKDDSATKSPKSSQKKKSKDTLQKEKDDSFSCPWTEMTDDGGCCALVVSMVAQRRVNYLNYRNIKKNM